MSLAVAGFLADRYIQVNNTLTRSESATVKVTVRLDPEYAQILDEIAPKLEMSRTGFAAQLLEMALLEARAFMEDPIAHIEGHEAAVDESVQTMFAMRAEVEGS